jgi:hypothetical protein
VPRAPLPIVGVTHKQDVLTEHLGRHYSSFIALKGSCARPNPSHRLRLSPWSVGLCRLSLVPAGRWPFPTLSLQSLCSRLDPYPATSLGCIYPFLLQELRPHKTGKTFGTWRFPCNATSTGCVVSRLQSFVYLQASTLARPPGCIHRSISWMLGSRVVYTTHSPGGYPIRDVVSLHVRHGQLTWLDSHQLDCSLVGCSFPHCAFLSASRKGL